MNQFCASQLSSPRGRRVVLGCTGSVASIYVPKITRQLTTLGYSVVVIPTSTALHFLRCQQDDENKDICRSENVTSPEISKEKICTEQETIATCGFNVDSLSLKSSLNVVGENSQNVSYSQTNTTRNINVSTQTTVSYCDKVPYEDELCIVCDEKEWASWTKRGDPVLHVELREWADLLLLVPLDANTLAKLANGLCDNLLTCVARAWLPDRPVLFCPAMNTAMYGHPLTDIHRNILKDSLGYKEVPVVVKTLMCGQTGLGGMAPVEDIVQAVCEILPL